MRHLQFLHHLQQHIHILRQSDVTRILNVELSSVQMILVKEFVLLTRHIHHGVLIHPVIDHHDLILGHALRHDILLEVL